MRLVRCNDEEERGFLCGVEMTCVRFVAGGVESSRSGGGEKPTSGGEGGSRGRQGDGHAITGVMGS